MEKQINLMNRYIANLAVLNIKLHNLHWNVIGPNFEQAHVFLEKLYDDLFEKFDEVAERVKMLGNYPNANMKSYLETSTIKELPNQEIYVKDALKIALEEYESLIVLSSEIRSLASVEDDFVTVALMEAHIALYDKEIWFMKSALK